MREKVLHSITGIFNTPDEIIEAAEKTAEAGYTKFDVNTPYPVHGMDGAMKLPPSKLGYASLVFGLSGTFAALVIMYWMSAVDYPLVIGGKPFFSFPAYVPIMFEVTVLAASIATVMTMLFVFFKFPNNSHPLHDTGYMRKVSSDKYGLCIMAEDDNFSLDEVKKFFGELGAEDITEIYFDDSVVSWKTAIFEPKFVAALAVVALIVSGATYLTLNKLLFAAPFNWMVEQEKIIPQEKSEIFADGFGMRKPVAGTVARGDQVYPYHDSPEEAALFLKNPLLPSKENLELGKEKFDTFCSPCHGYYGEGDSRLRGQFPNPPSLHSEKVRNWSDGRIYHVIEVGQNVMPSYAYQMTNEEKWAAILYVRALQRSLNARESDLE